MYCPNCKCPTAVIKNKPVFGNAKKHKDKGEMNAEKVQTGYESRVYCSNCGWLLGVSGRDLR